MSIFFSYIYKATNLKQNLWCGRCPLRRLPLLWWLKIRKIYWFRLWGFGLITVEEKGTSGVLRCHVSHTRLPDSLPILCSPGSQFIKLRFGDGRVPAGLLHKGVTTKWQKPKLSGVVGRLAGEILKTTVSNPLDIFSNTSGETVGKLQDQVAFHPLISSLKTDSKQPMLLTT